MKLKNFLYVLLVSGISLISSQQSIASTPKSNTPRVVVSIPPLYMIAREVMEGIAVPSLIIQGSSSPHDFTLKPSEANTILNAQIIFWIGKDLEHGLNNAIHKASKQVKVITLMNDPKIKLLSQEKGHSFGHHSHDHSGLDDPHIWLDPDNAIRIATILSEELSKVNPAYAHHYAKNTHSLIRKIEEKAAKLKEALQPYRHQPFIVFHNAYQYFEAYFQLNPSSAVTLNPENPLKIRRLQDLKDKISTENIKCLFTEPQFPAKFTKTLITNTKIKVSFLDPLGNDKISYIELLEGLGHNIIKCLKD